ncbi:MAG TPA: glycosyltransferase family 1 protein [Candidatus Aquicultor sp.]|jgi:glycosyltransferase involved in cell wall biosynthesis
MQKIGIFLEAAPYYGGGYQYDLAILHALAALPRSRFEIVVAYSDPAWSEIIMPYAFEAVMIPSTFPGLRGRALAKVGRLLERWWDKYNLPVAWWRNIAHYLHPVARTLVVQQCHLWIFPSQDAWSYKVKVPVLVTIHDLMHRYQSCFPEVSENGQYEYREKLYSNMCWVAKGILVDSELGRQQVHECYNIPKERIYVLPFIPPHYIFENNAAPDFDTKYALPKKFIFYPAQFWQHKNHINLIKAVALLKDEVPDIGLVLVGSQEKNGYKQAKQLVGELGLNNSVYFMGYVPNQDMPEFYKRARALIMPTYFGPTNIPPLEAFVLGCPVACSNIFAMPEQVGDAAILFGPESVREIAESIHRLWVNDQLCKGLAEKGKLRVSSWGQTQFNQRFLEIIEQ